MAVSYRKAKNTIVVQFIRLDVSTLSVWYWSTREFSELQVFSLYWIPKKWIQIWAMEFLSKQGRWTCQREWIKAGSKEAKGKKNTSKVKFWVSKMAQWTKAPEGSGDTCTCWKLWGPEFDIQDPQGRKGIFLVVLWHLCVCAPFRYIKSKTKNKILCF